MKRTGVVVFTTFLGCAVSVFAQQVGADGHLQRAAERTADQPADKAKPAPQAAPEKPAEKPAAAKAEDAAKPAAKPVAAAQPKKLADAAKPASPAPAPAKKAVEPKLINGIPEGAVQLEPYSWAYTDSEGKEWIYRRTPFGVSRVPHVETARAATSGGDNGMSPSRTPDIRVAEVGDDLQFEQSSPFGVRKWTKKKTELNSDEQAAWDRLKKKD